MNEIVDADFVPPRRPAFAELTLTFVRIGVMSFGGPARQIGMMHRILVMRSADFRSCMR